MTNRLAGKVWGLGVSFLAAMLLACGDGNGSRGNSNSTPSPVATSLTASASWISAGQSVTITAVFSGGTGVVDNGVGAVTSGEAVTVTPSATTTYTLTVTNSVGSTATKSVTVTATEPAILSFTATPTTLAAGQTVSLSAEFTGGVGDVFEVTGGTIPYLQGHNDHGPITSGVPMVLSPVANTVYGLTVMPPDNHSVAAAVASVVVNTPGGLAMIVKISGLASNVDAEVTVTGPNAYTQSLTQSTTLTGLTSGSYTVTAPSFLDPNGTGLWWVASGMPFTTDLTEGTVEIDIAYQLMPK